MKVRISKDIVTVMKMGLPQITTESEGEFRLILVYDYSEHCVNILYRNEKKNGAGHL